MNKKTGKKKLRCGKCGATGVRIYRPYQSFYKPGNNRCNGCLGEEERGWFVPCVQDDDGSIWGLTSIPQDGCDAFRILPERSDDHPSWPWHEDWDKKDGEGGTLICSYKTGDNTEDEQNRILIKLMEGVWRHYPRRRFIGSSIGRCTVAVTLSVDRNAKKENRS